MPFTKINYINLQHFNPFHATQEELIAQSLNDSGLITEMTTINDVPARELLEIFFAKRNMYRNATRLGTVLIESGKIPQEKLKAALEYQKENKNMKLGEILIKLGVNTEEEIESSLQIQSKKRAGT
nr:hypothetical protein [Desulfobulbaceae bacterium]